MSTGSGEAFTIAFVGYADEAMSERASAYEDEVLPLLAEHGARLVYRGRRAPGQSASLPLEVHVIWVPDRAAFDAYLADERRLALMKKYGEVFTRKEVVAVETLADLASARAAQ